MVPTLEVGRPLLRQQAGPQRSGAATSSSSAIPPTRACEYVQRVVALGGDTVAVEDGRVPHQRAAPAQPAAGGRAADGPGDGPAHRRALERDPRRQVLHHLPAGGPDGDLGRAWRSPRATCSCWGTTATTATTRAPGAPSRSSWSKGGPCSPGGRATPAASAGSASTSDRVVVDVTAGRPRRRRSADQVLATRSGSTQARSACWRANCTRPSSLAWWASLVSTKVTLRRAGAAQALGRDVEPGQRAVDLEGGVGLLGGGEDGVQVEIDGGAAADHAGREVADHAHGRVLHGGDDAAGLGGPVELEVVVHRGQAPVEAAAELEVVVQLPVGADVQLDPVQEGERCRPARGPAPGSGRADRASPRGSRPTGSPRRGR